VVSVWPAKSADSFGCKICFIFFGIPASEPESRVGQCTIRHSGPRAGIQGLAGRFCHSGPRAGI